MNVYVMIISDSVFFVSLSELVGDPLDVDTAENLISVMEISEEASGCLCWNPSVTTPTSKIGRSSVVIIQSKWRAFIAAKNFSAMKKQRILLE